MFKRAAITSGCEVIEGTKIQTINPATPAITLENGTIVSSDLLIGADGAFSKVRKCLFPDFRGIQLASDTTWQIQLDFDYVENDPILRKLVDPDVEQNTMRVGAGLTW